MVAGPGREEGYRWGMATAHGRVVRPEEGGRKDNEGRDRMGRGGGGATGGGVIGWKGGS